VIPTSREIRTRLAFRERLLRLLHMAEIPFPSPPDVCEDAGQDGADALHGGPLAVDMAHDTTPDPADSTNPGGNSWRSND
jgi:hypothetical protein